MGSVCSNANVPHTSNEKNFNVFDLDASNKAQHVEWYYYCRCCFGFIALTFYRFRYDSRAWVRHQNEMRTKQNQRCEFMFRRSSRRKLIVRTRHVNLIVITDTYSVIVINHYLVCMHNCTFHIALGLETRPRNEPFSNFISHRRFSFVI